MTTINTAAETERTLEIRAVDLRDSQRARPVASAVYLCHGFHDICAKSV
jgi:hypothetical protein